MPYIFIAPTARPSVSWPREVFHENYASLTRLLRAPDIAALGRLLNVDDGALNAELFGYLVFAPEFTDRLFDMGRRHAARWTDKGHDLRLCGPASRRSSSRTEPRQARARVQGQNALSSPRIAGRSSG